MEALQLTSRLRISLLSLPTIRLACMLSSLCRGKAAFIGLTSRTRRGCQEQMRVGFRNSCLASIAIASSTLARGQARHASSHSSTVSGFIAASARRRASALHNYMSMFRLYSSNDGDCGGSSSSPFATSYHAPVMCQECVDSLLQCHRDGPVVFVDGTLGGGGHSAAILERLQPGDVLFGCDVDSAALETASKRLAPYMSTNNTPSSDSKPLFIPVQSNFCNLASKIPKILHPVTQEPIAREGVVDGILLDLGVSSHQIDTAERGFAFMKDGPLDMRMGGTGLSAADICNHFDETELRRILKVYGDEPRAQRISQSIVERRPLTRTNDLVEAVAAVTPPRAKSRRMGRTASLARVFQAFRIVVNQEDEVLEKALMQMSPSLIRTGGRLVVLSYHSMEDRYVKRVIRDGSVKWLGTQQHERDFYGNYTGKPKPFRPVGKRQKATEKEVELNPRARSATLRVAERLES